jgi:hypothetical protein
MKQPYLGQQVIFVPEGLVSRKMAAFVSQVHSEDKVNLMVVQPGGNPVGYIGVGYNPKGELGSWHFNEDEGPTLVSDNAEAVS